MVGISSKPLPSTMIKHLDMDALRRQEANNAKETQQLLRKQKHAAPRISSDRLKRLRRAIVTHSKKMRTNTSLTQRARTISETSARKEAQRRKTAYVKKRPVTKRRRGDDSMWYNQSPSFYRGSSSPRRRGKRSRSRRRRPVRRHSRRTVNGM
jgi:hypothetical protein